MILCIPEAGCGPEGQRNHGMAAQLDAERHDQGHQQRRPVWDVAVGRTLELGVEDEGLRAGEDGGGSKALVVPEGASDPGRRQVPTHHLKVVCQKAPIKQQQN